MPLHVLDRACKLVLKSSLVPESLTVLWHAGEPLAAGRGFFEDAAAVLQRNNVHCKQIVQTLQTNGTLINQKWCDLFKRHHFQVGLSFDGPEFLHDRNRVGWHGKGSFAAAMKGLDQLKSNGVTFSGICVLTSESLNYPDEVFDFFVDSGFSSFAFNVEEIEAAHRKSSLLDGLEFTDTRKRYVTFMERIAERWIMAKGQVYIREFEHMAQMVLANKRFERYVPMLDVSQGLQIVTIRTDGCIVTYSPELATGDGQDGDAFVIGHIEALEELEDLFSAAKYRALRAEIKKGISKCADECAYFSMCGGGWPSNKYAENGTFNCSETRSCVLHTKLLADIVIGKLKSASPFCENEFDDTPNSRHMLTRRSIL